MEPAARACQVTLGTGAGGSPARTSGRGASGSSHLRSSLATRRPLLAVGATPASRTPAPPGTPACSPAQGPCHPVDPVRT
eukprot:767646-Hanusia_phi.AAC.5